MKRWRMALKLVAVVFGGVLIYQISSTTLQDSGSEIVDKNTDPLSVHPIKVEIGKIQNMNRNEGSKGSEVTAIERKNDKVWSDFKYADEIASYSVIQSKVFLSEDEKALRKKFLEDQDMLRSFKSILLIPAQDMKTMKMQNAALDILFESFELDPQGISLELFKDVISNPTVEDAQLSSQERQAVAEIKAEILFRVSAAVPESRAELESLLPGPVSQRLWQNVVAQQKSNLAESALERAR